MRRLFAEQFAVALTGPVPPRPYTYDEERGYSVTREGTPFIDSGHGTETVTFTHADGEQDDDDREEDTNSAVLETITVTEAGGEHDDQDEDESVVARSSPQLHTESKASGERPDVSLVAHTETAAPGEPPDFDIWADTVTMTFVHSESVDDDQD